MNETCRWMLLLGSAIVAALELPRDAEVLAHDLSGPYCSCASQMDAFDPGARHLAAAGLWQTADNDLDPARVSADTEATFHELVDGVEGAALLRADR